MHMDFAVKLEYAMFVKCCVAIASSVLKNLICDFH